ncbi:MAG: N-acetyltransferase [Roseburia sp.]|nr:N-acetyltransferase [Roseburia sp.]
MEDIRSFRNGDLQSVKEVLRESFFAEGKDEVYNEWEFAERVLKDEGFRKQLCLVASEGEEIIGYCLMTDARIEEEEGLALGPVAVREEYRGKGVGTRLIDVCLGRAREAGFPWAVVLGGEFYHRFGFETAKTWGVFLPEGQQGNECLQILFFDAGFQGVSQGEIRFCDSFYDKKGKLL